MSDEKKPSYELAFDQRRNEIEKSIESPHKGAEIITDPETEIKPSRQTVQLGQGFKK